MKTIIKKYLVVVMMFATLINYANENKTSINVIDGKKVRVEFKTVKKGQTLSIKDENGIVIYSYEIKTSGAYSKIFDLSKLEKGNYTTELEKDFEIVVKSFKVLEGEISFEEEITIFKPKVRIENNLVYISKISFDKQPLKISLYYKDEVILTETVTNSDDILNRVYRVLEDKKGNYSVVIKSNGRSFIKNFKI